MCVKPPGRTQRHKGDGGITGKALGSAAEHMGNMCRPPYESITQLSSAKTRSKVADPEATVMGACTVNTKHLVQVPISTLLTRDSRPLSRAVGTLGGVTVDEAVHKGREGWGGKEAGHGRGAKTPVRRREWCSGGARDQGLWTVDKKTTNEWKGRVII